MVRERSELSRCRAFAAQILALGLTAICTYGGDEITIGYPYDGLTTSRPTVRVMGRVLNGEHENTFVRVLPFGENQELEHSAGVPESATIAGDLYLTNEVELTVGTNLVQVSSARIDESHKQVIVSQASILVYRKPHAGITDEAGAVAADASQLLSDVNLPRDGLVRRTPFLLTGTLNSPNLVQSVEVNGVIANIEENRFTAPVLVSPGANQLDIEIRDTNGVAHVGTDWVYGQLDAQETEVFRGSLESLTVCDPEEYSYCRVDFTVENRDRYVWGEVNAECPLTVHSVPWGNWGVDSNFGSRQDGRQFMGWMWADWENGGLYDDPEWNSCTRIENRGSPLYYNHDRNTTQWSPDPSPYGVGFAVLGSWRKNNGCLAIENYTFVVADSRMILYELDTLDKDERIGYLYFGPLVATQPFSGCSYIGCPAGQVTSWAGKIQHTGEWDAGEAKIRAVVSRPPRVYYRREVHCDH